MAKAYFVVTEEIHDPEGMGSYAELAMPSIAKYGGKPIAFDTAGEVVEGVWHGHQTVILEFDSFETAKAWHDSEEYAPALAIRSAATTSNGVILHGF